MNVIIGEENLVNIDERYTALELDTLIYDKDKDPITNYAIVGPDELGLNGILKLKQMAPLHEALIKNYKKGDLKFCVDAIGHLEGNMGEFMDTFYEILLSRINRYQENSDKNWEYIVDLT